MSARFSSLWIVIHSCWKVNAVVIRLDDVGETKKKQLWRAFVNIKVVSQNSEVAINQIRDNMSESTLWDEWGCQDK